MHAARMAQVAIVLKQGTCTGNGHRNHRCAGLDGNAECTGLELTGTALFSLVAGALRENDEALAALHNGSGVVQGALSSIFILYDPAGFQQTTGTLRYLDGSLPQSDADSDWWNMVYRWTDCPVLAGLDLGDYASDAVQSESGSSQELMSRYYIGIRGAWNKDSAGLLEGGEELWNKLTAGAVSTASAEG